MTQYDISGESILVTGASGGIGVGQPRRLARYAAQRDAGPRA